MLQSDDVTPDALALPHHSFPGTPQSHRDWCPGKLSTCRVGRSLELTLSVAQAGVSCTCSLHLLLSVLLISRLPMLSVRMHGAVRSSYASLALPFASPAWWTVIFVRIRGPAWPSSISSRFAHAIRSDAWRWPAGSFLSFPIHN